MRQLQYDEDRDRASSPRAGVLTARELYDMERLILDVDGFVEPYAWVPARVLYQYVSIHPCYIACV
ncbi:MAG: hypothetical protein CL494_05745 [Actinobacteria bacterium]|nr:hypothetical protein [Actinomycetota bacterium]